MTSSREHVIPEALGGQLVTTDVCTQCNGDMGSQVDATFADSKYMQFVRLAYQDFLSPRAVPTILRDGEVADASGSERFPGRFRLSIAGIEFEPRYHPKVVGNVTTYYMPDTPDGKKNFDRLRSSRSKNIQSAEWIDLPAAPDSLTIAGDMLLPYPREVIKMFLGFLAAEGMLELALRPTFDDAREYLQTGDAGRLGSGYEMSTGVRTGPLELDTATGHELGFTRDGPHDVFQILLSLIVCSFR